MLIIIISSHFKYLRWSTHLSRAWVLNWPCSRVLHAHTDLYCVYMLIVSVKDPDPQILSDALECCVCIRSIVTTHLYSVTEELMTYFVSSLLFSCQALLVRGACISSESSSSATGGRSLLCQSVIIEELSRTVQLIVQNSSTEYVSMLYMCI